MGSGKSKKKVPDSKISPTKRLNIYKMFNAVRKEEVSPVTREMLQNLWKNIFSHQILELMMNYLFSTTQTIKVDDLEVMFSKIVEGTAEERAQILVDILGVENNISAHILKTFVADLIESYIVILQKKYPESFSSWVSEDITVQTDLKIVIEFFMRDLKYLDQKVSVKDLRDWLLRCVFVCDIYESIMNFAFNMEVEEPKQIVPRGNKCSRVLSVPMVLAFSHLVYGHMKKDWRLLYSSLADAQSWNILCTNIVKQGPTFVLIEDNAGSLFGGFTSQSWKICPNFYGNESSFLFRLRPVMALFSPTGYNQNFQYMNHGAATLPNGLGMGGQLNYFTFFLSAEFGPVTVSKSCSTFRDYTPFSHASEFTFSKLEIWAIGDPEKEEENARAKGSIMEKDPGAAAILEIAGKSIYSKNLKQSIDEE